MKIIRTVKEMQAESKNIRAVGRVIGFVPTMGFFHEGHLSLIRTACQRADVVVVSIFVNPVQFAPNEDLDAYPRDFERDVRLADKAGADIIFYPDTDEMYPPDYMTYVEVDNVTNPLCGRSRPEHFRGVTTICAKLFNCINASFAVFGQKDYQQTVVIKQMVKDLNFNIDIVTAPLIREQDGLAMSSRNKYLSAAERKDACLLNEALFQAVKQINQGTRKAEPLIKAIRQMIEKSELAVIEYVEIVHPDTLAQITEISANAVIALAVKIGKTRLIDNVLIECSPSNLENV